MKKLSKMVGVTLLEVMLVLAVAAMIIVMSIRYYQSATINQQVNGALGLVQGIGAAADSLSQGTGSFVTGAPAADVLQLMPNNSMATPWGTNAVYAPAATRYTITLPNTPPGVAVQICSRLRTNRKYNPAPTNCGGGNMVITYDATR